MQTVTLTPKSIAGLQSIAVAPGPIPMVQSKFFRMNGYAEWTNQPPTKPAHAMMRITPAGRAAMLAAVSRGNV